ncbi:MAG: hypothetical protein VX460_06885 [Planctomycetota bacterium]|nr:hypothetical protein [Planctomycetota bacterium]
MTRTAAALLERLLAQRYRALERSLTAGIGLEEATFHLGGRPNISWHARHLAEAIASTHEALFGERSEGLSEALEGPWPAPREVALAGAAALRARLAEATDEDLALPPQVTVIEAFKDSLTSRQRFLEGHLYHVAYHVGSVAVLRAEQGLD